ncbi:DUF3800 domain-containing protein [Sphingomonas psychrotolerans]|uniref:DUF3800 domain-containing protein n=1 Tax=Sphingomonas psychrotolerans TaxID=1327635 RepID=A0ABU3N124_9SPHN|nr:DUF3800 domain-containing protein [Sphingomonas psychrotolerans]MDT8758245.1 DUF3800 domain-containing protein [Sphingomonas psychrotolerans]
MRFVFMDEAGTSVPEPVTVVVALIADADRHVMSAESLAKEALRSVPPHHQDGFVFHATQVFNDAKYQQGWSITDRLTLLKAMMSIPRRIGMAITVSAHWRDAVDYEGYDALGLSKSQFEHMLTFQQCIGVTDRNIRTHAGAQEVGTIVAEDVPELRKFLRKMPKRLRDNPYHFPPEHMRRTAKDEAAGYITQRGDLSVSRIRDTVHFVEKADDPLVQVADACAYGFRRYFAREKFGADFVDAILGTHQELAHFAAPCGTECFWPKADSQA